MKFRLLALSSLASLASCAAPAERGQYETPQYKAVVTDGAFEIREYPSLTVVSAPMTARKSGQNSAFMSLFRYISGKNAKAQKIEMTTPVFTTMQDAENAMSFVVPADVAERGVPEADDASIAIGKRPAGRFAVYRYSGRPTRALENAGREKLLAWIKERGLKTTGNIEKAGYDPPFTPPSKRRNEVLVRIQE